MKLCVPVVCFYGGLDFCEAVKKISRLGFSAIETYVWRGLDFDRVRNTCRDCGIDFVSMCTTEFNMTLPEKRSDWVAGLCESCEAAKRLGVTRLITQVGPDTGAPRREQHRSILEALRLAKPILEDSGVTLMLEPLNVLVDHPGYYLVSANEGFEIVREADSANIKLVYDVYHQQISEGNIIPSVVNNLDCIAHLHSAGHPGRHELQFGESNYTVIFDAIDKAGYSGYCGLEYSPTMPADESLATALKLYGSK